MNSTSRIVIITGANSGIGRAAVHRFASNGHTVVMACRSVMRSTPVREEAVAASGNAQVELMELDMSSFASIRAFAEEFRHRHDRLDVLIQNAGYFLHGSPYRLSTDGIELTFATNVFGPWLLTQVLRDRLAQSDDARILHAGSNIIKHFFNPKLRIDLSNLRGERPADPSFTVYDNYRNSKMALLMLTLRMAGEFSADGIGVNMLQINGARMSKETIRTFSPRYRVIARLQNVFFRPPEFMAGHYHDICTSDRFRGVTGKLINPKLEIMDAAVESPGGLEQFRQVTGAGRYPRYALDREMTDEIWERCKAWTREAQSGEGRGS
jgi:NAD(P)-dependent dehydrogenase (short-subunit alcohol dehydrogenase family)